MQRGKQTRKGMRGLAIASVVLLALLLSFLWQRVQPQRMPTVSSTQDPETAAMIREPIQPIPPPPDLDARVVKLGEKLFADPALSVDGTVSCLSCHQLDKGGTDQQARSRGSQGNLTAINTLTVFNAGLNFRLTWSGGFESLISHVDAHLRNPSMMGNRWETVVQTLQRSPDYQQAFQQIYPDGITVDAIQTVIATYEQSLVTPDSRFDRFLRGDQQALTATEKAGYEAFKKYGCISCHQGVNVGGNLFQKFGIMGDYFAKRGNVQEVDLGRFLVTGDEHDRYVFRVPSLRNVALTPPYFHDGSAKTLKEAIAIMAYYQLGRPISDTAIDKIAQFLNTLTGELQGKPL